MYDLDRVAAEADIFRAAVLNGQPYKPLYVKLKLIWHCNLRCGMCNHWRSKREPPLEIVRLKEVIDELATLGCRKIHISGGEPTLHPDLPELVAYMSERGLRVNMTTNATLITKPLAKSLAKARLRGVNVSIDSPVPRIHDRIRGVKGAWKRAVKGAGYLSQKLKKRKLRINTVVGRLNYNTLTGLPALAADLGASSLNLIPLDENTTDLKGLSKRQIVAYNQEIAPVIAEKSLALGLMERPEQAYPFGVTHLEVCHSKVGFYAKGYYEAQRCFVPWTHALIDHIGRVGLCCMLRERPILGDLRHQSFTEIWTGEKYAELRRQKNLPLFGRCRRCDDFLAENRQLAELFSA
jgi:MoaA/NifB/PqqE/SkfB family radical SAM enzyme